MELEKEKNNFSKNILTEAFLILIITAISYWFAFRYESSYFSVFNIPIQLIDVSTSLLLSTVFSVSGVIFFLFFLWNGFLMFLPGNSVFQGKIIRIGMVVSFLFCKLLALGFRKEDFWLYFISIGFVILFEFLLPLLVFKNKKTYKEKIIAYEYTENRDRSKTIFGRVYDHFGLSVYLMLFLFLFANSLVVTFGSASAKKQIIFPVDVKEDDVAVIRMYKDKVICIRYNPDKKEVLSFFVRDSMSNEYKNKTIGPLN